MMSMSAASNRTVAMYIEIFAVIPRDEATSNASMSVSVPQLAAAAVAAHTKFWDEKHGQRSLPATTQSKLSGYFVGKGVPVSELPLVVEASDVDAVKEFGEEWEDYCQSAGMTDLADRRNVLRWLKARAKGPVATRGGLSPGDRLTGAVKALEGAGSIVSQEARAELGKFLVERDAGEALVQYTSVDTPSGASPTRWPGRRWL